MRVLKSTLTFEQAAVMQRAAEVFRTADCLAPAIALLDAHVRAVERTQTLVDEAIRTMAGRELHPKREGWTIAPHALRDIAALEAEAKATVDAFISHLIERARFPDRLGMRSYLPPSVRLLESTNLVAVVRLEGSRRELLRLLQPFQIAPDLCSPSDGPSLCAQ